MAAIKKLGRRDPALPLVPLQVIGRAPSCRLNDSDAHVSGVHAEVRWNGASWLVEDLGSRNGTWVDGRRLRPRDPVPVRAGTRISVGRPENVWRVESDLPPVALAERIDGRVMLAQRGVLALPDHESPELVVYQSHEGGWVMDTSEGTVPARTNSVARVGDETWTLHLPEVLNQTLTHHKQVPTPRNVRLRLVVSDDGDQVDAWVQTETGEVHVGPRAAHQLLRLLAMARLEDERAGAHADDQGWRGQVEVAARLGLSDNALNVAVHRLRRQFEVAGLEDSSGVVERRASVGELRLGITRVVIETA